MVGRPAVSSCFPVLKLSYLAADCKSIMKYKSSHLTIGKKVKNYYIYFAKFFSHVIKSQISVA